MDQEPSLIERVLKTMRDDHKSKADLMRQLKALRKRVAELEQANCEQGDDGLGKSEAQFRQIFENTEVGVYRTTPDGRILMANPALVRMLGYSSFEELAQRNLEEEGYELKYSRSVFKEHTERDGRVVGLESAWIRRDGSTVFVIENSRAIRDEHGNTLYYEGTAENITERKEAEDKIKRAAEEWSKTFDATSDLVFVQDKDFRFVKVNKSVGDVLKVKPEDLIGKKCYEVLHKSDKPWPNCPLAKTLKNKRPHTEEVYDPNIGVPLLISTSPLFDENGELTGAVHIAKDITEHKKMDEALRQSEVRYRTLVENLPQRVFLKDRNSTYVSCNENFARDLGISPELLPGKSDYDFFPREFAEKYRADDKMVMESGEIRDIEEKALLQGQEMIIHTVKTPVRNEKGNVMGVLGIYWDITEQSRLERALSESEQKYRTLVESADETIITVDRDGAYLFMNKTGAERAGKKPEDYIGKTMWDMFPKQIAERQMDYVRKVIDAGEGMNVTVWTELQGQPHLYNATLEPLRDDSGKVVAAMIIARDITDIRQAEEELEAYRESMVRAERLASLGTLSATLAHELTQPLTVIALSIENSLTELEAVSCPQTVTDGLRDSLSGVSNAASIVERFRNFARKSSEKTVGKVDLKVVAERIVKLLNKSARQAGIRLRLKGMDTLPGVYSSEKEVEQLFFALVQNAIQAADGNEPRELIIDGAVKDKHIELRFSDNCGGIEPEDVDKVFDPFFTTKPAGEGTGLGLCIVQRVALRSGGRVRVENKPGEGSTFVVTLGINKDRIS